MTSSRPRIDRLRIEAFRGFRDSQEFDLSASAVIVTGPNGTGKTSFFDALQWGLTGRLERLEALKSRRNAEHIVNQYRLGGKAAVEITLRTDSGSILVKRRGDQGGNTLEVSRPGEQSWFGEEAERALQEILLPESELTLSSALSTSALMQQDVLRSVLEAKPADQFRELSAVLGLGAVEDFEEAVKFAAKQAGDRETKTRAEYSRLTQDLSEAKSKMEVAESRLASRPQIDALRTDVLAALRSSPAGISMSLGDLRLDAMEDVRDAASAFGKAIEGLEEALRSAEVAVRLRTGLDDEPTEVQLRELRKAAEHAEETRRVAEVARGRAQSELNSARKAATEVAKLAAAALPMLTSDCPVCGQTIDRAHVERTLLERANSAGVLLDLENSFVALANKFSEASESAAEVRQRVAALEQLVEDWRAFRAARDEASTAIASLDGEVKFIGAPTLDVADFSIQGRAAAEHLRKVRRQLHELLEAYDRQADQADIERAAAEIRNLETAVEASKSHLEAESAVAKRLREFSERTRESRLEVTRERLNSIEPLVANIYQRLDPHPAFKSVEFELDMYYNRGTSSPRVSDLEEQLSADPVLIFSTSQVNIVALSYFIAMSLSMERTGLPFLLLDDPVQSMDDVNVLGFADLCRHLRLRRQLIVSTHERRLSGLLERKLAPRSEDETTRVIQFTGWDRSGPTVNERIVGDLLGAIRFVWSGTPVSWQVFLQILLRG